MARPRRFRRISEEPQIRCFKPERDDLDSLKPIEILIDEFEAIRLRDYHDIQQKRSAEIMGVSQPTFHRILTSARKKIAEALINGNTIVIIGDQMIIYQCKNITVTKKDEYSETSPDSLPERRSYGGGGIGAGPPTVCKCPHCGYEAPKTRSVPCSNTKCPKCDTPLCGTP